MAVVDITSTDRVALVPDRSGQARAKLLEVARGVAPVVDARDRCIEVDGGLGAAIPRGLQRGTVTRVGGEPGSGVTTAVIQLVAAASKQGEWVAVVDHHGTFGGLAAVEAGAVSERFACVRRVARSQWPTVVGALLDGFGVVAAIVPVGLSVGVARRLTARTRERGSCLVAVESAGIATNVVGRWPGEVALRLEARGANWDVDSGMFCEPTVHVEVAGRGEDLRGRLVALAPAV